MGVINSVMERVQELPLEHYSVLSLGMCWEREVLWFKKIVRNYLSFPSVLTFPAYVH